MTRTTVSADKPDKAGDSAWIDINGHAGRLMSTLMADGRPFSIAVDPAGMTIITPLSPPAARTRNTEAADGAAGKNGTDPDGGRITNRRKLYDRFRSRLNENLAERKQ